MSQAGGDQLQNLPTGTVTFLFTDIEGSTRLWEEYPQAMPRALSKHDALLRKLVEAHGGRVVKTLGDGCHAVFETALDGINAALEAQRALASPIFDEDLPDASTKLKVRMGLHTGEAELRDSDYFGPTLNRAARIMASGSGGQVLLSHVTADIVRAQLPAGVSIQDLGEHKLKDLVRAERLYQLSAEGFPREFPALKSLNLVPNNLPLQLTSFIGREREINKLGALLAGARLLTLIGPGGTGKTRLALQVAAEHTTDFADGVFVVELASLTDAKFVLGALAQCFDLREVQSIPLIDVTLDYLRSKELLHILDNCEHLIEACAQLTSQLLHACPRLKILASSREALGIDGETVYRVPALPADDASRLFVERAVRAEPNFHHSAENVPFIEQICARLDGIPLAIELAAARVKVFSPEQIAARLDDRFKLLTGGSRTALPRQQTLRALIDWSYQSLSEREQRALGRLAVFAGGWTIEAAEFALEGADAAEALIGLVHKSLVIVEDQSGKVRYRFLETIRQYAMEKVFESGQAVEARDRQYEYMLQLAQKVESTALGAEELDWLDEMEEEHDNLRAALEWSLSNAPERALRLANAAAGFWISRDHNSEASSLCSTILTRTESLHGVDLLRARLHWLWGWSNITTGRHREGRAAAESGIKLARRVNDPGVLVRLLAIVALASIFLSDFPTAKAAAVEAESTARANKLQSELALMLTINAQVAYYATRDREQALAALREAESLARAAGFRWADSVSAFGLARIAAATGDMQTAREHFMRSADIARRLGNKRLVYSSYSELAHVLRENGQLDEPLATYLDLLPKWNDLGHRAAVAHELECVAYILRRKEEPERAATLLGAADALRHAIDAPMTNLEQSEYDQELASLRDLLGANLFEDHWRAGRQLTAEQAIQTALSQAA